MLLTTPPLLEVQGLCKAHKQARWWQHRFYVCALDHVNLVLRAGSTLALVGESGSGKTTLAMCIVGLEQSDTGDIRFEGKSLLGMSRTERIAARRDIQLVFQDSAGALSPRMSIAEIIEEPLLIRAQWSSKERAECVFEAMEQVGLSASWRGRRPNELSGGQRQRVAIARALVVRPRLLILDEALAGLDLSIQGQIANLLLDLQTSHELSYLFISHNLGLVFRIADEVAIINNGRVVEQVRPSEMLAQTERPWVRAKWPSTLREELAFDAHTGLRDLQ
ncbi:MAG: dipeptide/oligopeptide/nickel ABC transporter ATP-binding protein [Candidatus Sulfotelmatobacter sp.]